jgi:hypothetical protein
VALLTDLYLRKRVEACGNVCVAGGVTDVAAADPGGPVSHDEHVSQHVAVVCWLEEVRTEQCRIKWKEKERAR